MKVQTLGDSREGMVDELKLRQEFDQKLAAALGERDEAYALEVNKLRRSLEAAQAELKQISAALEAQRERNKKLLTDIDSEHRTLAGIVIDGICATLARAQLGNEQARGFADALYEEMGKYTLWKARQEELRRSIKSTVQ